MQEVTYSIELASVVVTTVDADLATVDAGVLTDVEVVGHEGVTVWLQNNLTLQECSLWHASVGLLRLSNHD